MKSKSKSKLAAVKEYLLQHGKASPASVVIAALNKTGARISESTVYNARLLLKKEAEAQAVHSALLKQTFEEPTPTPIVTPTPPQTFEEPTPFQVAATPTLTVNSADLRKLISMKRFIDKFGEEVFDYVELWKELKKKPEKEMFEILVTKFENDL